MFTDPAPWKVVALLAFFLFFLGVLAWTVVVGRTGRFQHDAGLPLDEGRPVPDATVSRKEQSHD
ncbi:MAG: hypothetical protein ACYTF3_05550 [Planctomycetota bacterium]|jgi:cbb3-type cytochrome oxidase subunit 3